MSISELEDQYLYVCLKGDTICAVHRFAFTFGVLIKLDDVGYKHRYCYDSLYQAKKALDEWSGTGEPYGWHRNPETGRRRPDGDHEREYVRW